MKLFNIYNIKYFLNCSVLSVQPLSQLFFRDDSGEDLKCIAT